MGGAFPNMEEPTGGGKLVSLDMGGGPRIELVGGVCSGKNNNTLVFSKHTHTHTHTYTNTRTYNV